MSRAIAFLTRAFLIALFAGLTAGLLETAAMLSEPGASAGSAGDLFLVSAWIGFPQAAGLLLSGLVGAAIGYLVLRVVGQVPGRSVLLAIFTAFAGAAGLSLWLRGLLSVNGGSPVFPVVNLIAALFMGLSAAAVGIAVYRLDGRGELARLLPWGLGGLAGLAVLLVASQPDPGPFGKPLPPMAFPFRFLIAIIVLAAILFVSRRVLASSVAIRRVAGAVLALVFLAWGGLSAVDFEHLLGREPVVTQRAADGSAAGPNVVLISIDTLRADHLPCYGYAGRTAPRICGLADEGFLFARTASTSSFTLPAHASMMTGLFPTSHGATYQNRDPESFAVSGMGDDYPTLAELLGRMGYQTAGFASGPLMSHQFGFARGFDLYDDRFDRIHTARGRLFARSRLFRVLESAGVFSSKDLDAQRTADEVNPLVEEWMDGRDRKRPFFLFVHYWDPHGPYEPPPPHDVFGNVRLTTDYDMDRLLSGDYTLSPQGLGTVLRLYDREIAYVDEHVGQLLHRIGEEGLFKETMIIVTSDHGESFGEHQHWEHSRVLYEDVLRVPFIVRLPGASQTGVIQDVVAQPTDILPTILSALGADIPDGIEGRNLLPFMPGATADPAAETANDAGLKSPGLAFAELGRNVDWPERWGGRFDRDLTSARTLRYKYIRSSTGQEELFDLELDPFELTNLADLEKETATALRSLTDAWRTSLEARKQGDSSDIDEGLKQNLRSLGYIQ